MLYQLKKYITRKLNQAKEHINNAWYEVLYELPCPAKFILLLFSFILIAIFKPSKLKEAP